MEGFRDGYEFFRRNSGAVFGAFSGDAYVGQVNYEIDELVKQINSFEGNLKDPKILKGDVAEFWHSGTFNIDAAVKGSSNRATSLKSNGLGSIDILLKSGEKYGSKYDSTASKSLHEQAKTFYERYNEYASKLDREGKPVPTFEQYIKNNANELKANGIDPNSINPHDPLYAGQFRLVSSDQYETIKAQLTRKIQEESVKRPEQAQRYQETLDMLKDHIEDSDGNSSIKLSKEEAEQIAAVAKEGGFDPADWGLTTEQLISYEYVLSQAFKAGLSAATISMVLKIAPEIIKSITFLIKEGYIDLEHFKKIGFAAITGASEGFIRGSVSAAITTACVSGLWGEALKNVQPSVIGAITVIAMDTMKNAFSVANGKISSRQLVNELVKEMYVSSCSLIIGGVVQSVLIELPVLGFMMGSFIGSAIGGITYSLGYNAVLSFCVDTGWTMFGLVEQDYRLPESVMKEIGIDVFEYDRFEAPIIDINRFEVPKLEINRFEAPSVDIVLLRRGVIGINRIGYI